RANETKRRRRKPAAIKQQRTAASRHRSGPRFQANKELRRTDFAAQRLAISEVLRRIASSPHDLQPIFDTIIDSAVHLCRAEWGAFRLAEEIGFRLVASRLSRAVSAMYPPRELLEGDSFMGRLFGSKSPVHIPDLATHLERNSVGGEAERETISRGIRTVL